MVLLRLSASLALSWASRLPLEHLRTCLSRSSCAPRLRYRRCHRRISDLALARTSAQLCPVSLSTLPFSASLRHVALRRRSLVSACGRRLSPRWSLPVSRPRLRPCEQTSAFRNGFDARAEIVRRDGTRGSLPRLDSGQFGQRRSGSDSGRNRFFFGPFVDPLLAVLVAAQF